MTHVTPGPSVRPAKAIRVDSIAGLMNVDYPIDTRNDGRAMSGAWAMIRVANLSDTTQDAMVTLLSDLLHTSDALDLDFEACLTLAEQKYTKEVDGTEP